MTLERRLSKLEASILPEVRPPKVVTIRWLPRGEDRMRREIATSRPIPRTGVLPSWFSSFTMMRNWSMRAKQNCAA